MQSKKIKDQPLPQPIRKVGVYSFNKIKLLVFLLSPSYTFLDDTILGAHEPKTMISLRHPLGTLWKPIETFYYYSAHAHRVHLNLLNKNRINP